jgi:hypothetical protein
VLLIKDNKLTSKTKPNPTLNSLSDVRNDSMIPGVQKDNDPAIYHDFSAFKAAILGLENGLDIDILL